MVLLFLLLDSIIFSEDVAGLGRIKSLEPEPVGSVSVTIMGDLASSLLRDKKLI